MFFLSIGGIGFLPGAPGTYASAVGVALFYTLIRFLPVAPAMRIGIFVLLLLVLFGVSLPMIRAAGHDGRHDHSWIVIDEVIGMLIALVPFLFGNTIAILPILVTFACFRLLDIYKPLGIGHIDEWRAPAAVILDDVLAGVYTAIIVAALFLW